jgi:hypothetical protein
VIQDSAEALRKTAGNQKQKNSAGTPGGEAEFD